MCSTPSRKLAHCACIFLVLTDAKLRQRTPAYLDDRAPSTHAALQRSHAQAALALEPLLQPLSAHTQHGTSQKITQVCDFHDKRDAEPHMRLRV